MKPIDAYIPIDRRFALSTGKTLPEKSEGAVLFADISGFTPLTEILVHKFGAKRGAEELTGWLNKVYNALIAQVHCYYGSVISFSGDGIICWFDGDDGFRATTCGLMLQNEMAQIKVKRSQTNPVNLLGLKVAVAAGPVRRFVVGYSRVQLLEVLAGKTLGQMAMVESVLQQGEVGVTQNVAETLSDRAYILEGRAVNSEEIAIIKSLHTPAPPNPWPDIPPLDDETARDWLLPPIYQRLHHQEAFLAELRPAVSLFLKFEGIDYDQDSAAGEKFNAFIRWVQRILAQYHGYLLQLTTGDKGSYLYAVFGAPVALENNVLRAVEAAVYLREVPPELHFVRNITIGISQGQMRVGAYGAKTRRTYGVLGKEVNVAARLMIHNPDPGQILVTEPVARAIADKFKLQDFGLSLLKGQPRPLPIFKVLYKQSTQFDIAETGDQIPLIGRIAERKTLVDRLNALLDGQNSVVIIEGEAGIGKSKLVTDLIGQAQKLGLPVLMGVGNQVEQNTAYFAWRPIFQSLFGIDAHMGGPEVQQRVLKWFEQTPDLKDRAPLLNIMLPNLNLPENELTSQLTGEVRVDNTLDLLIRILNSAEFPVAAYVLILENVHRLDSASLALATAVVRQSTPALMLTLVTRPFDESAPAAYRNLLEAQNLWRLKLKRLSIDESAQLVYQQLGVDEISPDVMALIYKKADGNPLFSREIVFALRDQGIITINHGNGDTHQALLNVDDPAAIPLPDTVQGAIINRIDQLSPWQQLTLKIAAVIGFSFSFNTLQDIFPNETERDNLARMLDQMQKRNLVYVESTHPQLTYCFNHSIIRDVIYDLMTSEQRESLHQQVAIWYESTYHYNLASHYSTLIHHWERAGNKVKTLEYLEKAGEQTLHNGIFQQAVHFLGKALTLSEPNTSMYAIWQARLALAQYGLGQLTQSRKNNEQALTYLDRSIPKTQLSLKVKLAQELVRRWFYQLWPVNRMSLSENELDKLVNAISAYQCLFRIYNEENKRVLGGYVALRQLNLAHENLGPSPELVRAYTMMGVVLAFLNFQTLADTHFVKAAKIVERLSSAGNLRAMIWRSSALYQVGRGNLLTVQNEIQRAIKIFDHLGDKSSWRDCMAIFGVTCYYTGNFNRSAQLMEELVASGADDEVFLQKTWGLVWQGASLMRLGQLDESVGLLIQASSLLNNQDYGVTNLSCWGLLAITYWRQGDVDAAWEAANKVDELITQSKSFSGYPFSLDGYAGVSEFYFALWESNNFERATPKKITRAAEQATKSLKKYTRRYRIGQPSAYLHQGLYDWMRGKQTRAKQAWHKGLAAAKQMGMRYEQGRLLYQLGRCLPANIPERQAYLLKSQMIFEELGAVHDLGFVCREIG